MSDNKQNKSNVSVKDKFKEINNENQNKAKNDSFSLTRTILERNKLITNRTYFYLKK